MGEQPVDLRAAVGVLRRHKGLAAVAAELGAALGLALVLLQPPVYSSSAQVLLKSAPSVNGQPATRDIETDIRIASSDAVLGPAGRQVRPTLGPRQVAKRVEVVSLTPDVLEVVATGPTPRDARSLAEAVAAGVVDYDENAASSATNAQVAALASRARELRASLATVGAELKETAARRARELPGSVAGKADAAASAQLTAQQASLVLQLDQIRSRTDDGPTGDQSSVLQHATPALRPPVVGRAVLFAVLGAALLLGITVLLLTTRSRRDHRLRARDDIADALGAPVVASLRCRPLPRSVAQWTSLLESYAPGPVEAWAIRQALRQLAPGEKRSLEGSTRPREARMVHPMSLTVVTFADDGSALAVGPQVATHAASSGLRTQLLAVRGQDSTTALWAACAGVREGELRENLAADTRPELDPGTDLTVVLVVVERRDPVLTDLPPTAVTLLAVSPGTATAEDLARVALHADQAGTRIEGVVVADPDSLDHTTGRLLQHERNQLVPLPTRLTGVPTERPGPAQGRRRPS